jgi:glycerate kinase
MRVLIAPDKFKGSLSAAEAGAALGAGWRDGWPAEESLEIEYLPMAGSRVGERKDDWAVAVLCHGSNNFFGECARLTGNTYQDGRPGILNHLEQSDGMSRS